MTNKKFEKLPCSFCKGTGQKEPDCLRCNGQGYVPDYSDGLFMNCPDCDNEKCEFCDGEGFDPTYDKNLE